MAASPEYHVYHGDPLAAPAVVPRCPGIDDVGGGAKEDDAEYPPDPTTDPTADDDNQKSRLHVSWGQVVMPVSISISFVVGVPTVTYFRALDYTLVAATLIASGDLVITDNAAGDTSIQITSSLVPARFLNPHGLTIHEDISVTPIDRIGAEPLSGGGFVGVRVKTMLGAVGTDADFTISF